MIQLNDDQRQALATAEEAPPHVIDPVSRQEYVLLRLDVYTQIKAIMDGYTKRAAWDDPALDVYESYRKPK